MQFEPQDLNDLQLAKSLLENPGLAARLTGMLGTPLERGLAMLPKGWGSQVNALAQTALLKASDAALRSLRDQPGSKAHKRWHTMGVAASGAAGGFFGLAGLAVELPITTTVMLRSIADIARSEGESLAQADTRHACIEVFALGGPTPEDDALESGYFAVRAALATSISEATRHIATRQLSSEGAPVLVRLISTVASRFGVQVTEKAAAQTVPALGAAGGAAINTLFINHFQDMAQGHFIVRRLERRYGKEEVRHVYSQLPAS